MHRIQISVPQRKPMNLLPGARALICIEQRFFQKDMDFQLILMAPDENSYPRIATYAQGKSLRVSSSKGRMNVSFLVVVSLF